jgi:thiol-disulfide isomerase/thioredoxin
MKTIKLIFIALVVLNLAGFAQSPEANDSKAVANTNKVSVYYFHFNTRCETCRAVESEAQQDVKELFGDKVNFAAYNLDEKAGEAVGKEIGVSSQMLVIVKGKKKIDLTNEGFLYAVSNPAKFKEIIEKKVKPLL